MNLLSVAGPGGVIVSLNNFLVFSQEFEVDFVLRFVPFKGREIDVEIEAAGVAFWAFDESAECSIQEASGGSPPCAAAVVVGESDGIGLGAMETGFWGVVDSYFFEGMGLVVIVGFWVKSGIRHCC